MQKYLIDRICNVTHAYNHQNITYGQELIIELTYNTPYPRYEDSFSCGVYYNCAEKNQNSNFHWNSVTTSRYWPTDATTELTWPWPSTTPW